MDIKELIQLNYDAVVLRQLIDENTQDFEFYEKAKEELKEVFTAIMYESEENQAKEWTDLLVVCLNRLTHFKCDIEKLLKENAEKNFERAKALTNAHK